MQVIKIVGHSVLKSNIADRNVRTNRPALAGAVTQISWPERIFVSSLVHFRRLRLPVKWCRGCFFNRNDVFVRSLTLPSSGNVIALNSVICNKHNFEKIRQNIKYLNSILLLWKPIWVQRSQPQYPACPRMHFRNCLAGASHEIFVIPTAYFLPSNSSPSVSRTFISFINGRRKSSTEGGFDFPKYRLTAKG